MKLNDIDIGRLYTNSMHPGAVYLGCGRADRGKNKKYLVVIQGSALIGWVCGKDPQFWASLVAMKMCGRLDIA